MNRLPKNYYDRRNEGDTILRKCQLVQLRLLHIVDKICKDNDIKYCLMSGTLLGALRHNGFIPWDDDLDLWMPSADYKKFAEVAPKCAPEGVYVQTSANTPQTAIPFMKVRDSNTFYYEPRLDIMTDEPSGIYIDIFKLERLPKINIKIWKCLVKCCASAWSRKIYFLNLARKGLHIALWAVPVALICKILYLLVRGFIDIWRYISPGQYYASNFEGMFQRVYDGEDLFPFRTHVFEDGEFPVPNNSDAILTRMYGKWRDIPPPDKRPHHARVIDPFQSGK